MGEEFISQVPLFFFIIIKRYLIVIVKILYCNPLIFNTDGVMKTGWILDNGSWYCCDESGAMLDNATVGEYVLDSIQLICFDSDE